MEYFYVVLLRLLHVGIGVFWAGTGIYLAGFVLPAIRAAGPEGARFMQVLTKTNHVPRVMDIASTVTILSGILLYYKMSSGLQPEWIASRYGASLTVGGLAAITAYLIGIFVNGPAVGRLGVIGAEIAKAGGPPTPEQVGQMAALRVRLTNALNAIAVLMVISAAAMGVARYL